MQTVSGKVDLELILSKYPEDEIERIATPAYLYDHEIFQTRSNMLMGSLNFIAPRLKVFYSMKANPSKTILKWTIQEGYMTEVSSSGELRHALKTGQRADKILLLGPGKSEGLISYAMEIGIYGIVVESHRELDIALKLHNGRTKIFVRVNSEKAVPNVKEAMTGPESKFGIPVEELPDALKSLKSIDSRMVGLHYYMESQLLDHRMMIKLHRNMLSLLSQYSNYFDSIDLGGGFGIPYSRTEHELDLPRFASGMRIILQDLKLEDKLIHFETGRYIASDCGTFLTRVVDVKNGKDGKILITDGGMNSFMRIAFMHEQHPVRLIFPRKGSSENGRYSIFGPLCTPLDCFGTGIEMPEGIRSGDLIGILKAGAYGLSMSPIFFLLQDIPGEYFFSEGKISESTRKISNPEEFFEQMF